MWIVSLSDSKLHALLKTQARVTLYGNTAIRWENPTDRLYKPVVRLISFRRLFENSMGLCEHNHWPFRECYGASYTCERIFFQIRRFYELSVRIYGNKRDRHAAPFRNQPIQGLGITTRMVSYVYRMAKAEWTFIRFFHISMLIISDI